MRKFERISFEQFKKDVCDDMKLYEKIELPKRGTSLSAGYDIRSVVHEIIKPGESKVIKTGIKVFMQEDEALFIYIRSSLGFKYDVCLSNNVGLIDADFYNNPENEGHINLKIINHGKEDFEIKIGDRVVQGVFMKYLKVTDETNVLTKRIGTSGSTGRE